MPESSVRSVPLTRSHDVKLLDTIPETQIPLVDWAVDDRQPLPELSHRDQEIKDSNVWLEKCTISKEGFPHFIGLQLNNGILAGTRFSRFDMVDSVTMFLVATAAVAPSIEQPQVHFLNLLNSSVTSLQLSEFIHSEEARLLAQFKKKRAFYKSSGT